MATCDVLVYNTQVGKCREQTFSFLFFLVSIVKLDGQVMRGLGRKEPFQSVYLVYDLPKFLLLDPQK